MDAWRLIKINNNMHNMHGLIKINKVTSACGLADVYKLGDIVVI